MNMKLSKLKISLIIVLLLLIITIGSFYLLLLRLYEDLPVSDVNLNEIGPFSGGSYPVIIRDIGDLKDKIIIEKDVPLVMRDGTRLSANVF